jgi:hypothetical protein
MNRSTAETSDPLKPDAGKNSRTLHCAPPDFPFRPVALMDCLRLSEKKHSVWENQ